jgi:hypothetical protein
MANKLEVVLWIVLLNHQGIAEVLVAFRRSILLQDYCVHVVAVRKERCLF